MEVISEMVNVLMHTWKGWPLIIVGCILGLAVFVIVNKVVRIILGQAISFVRRNTCGACGKILFFSSRIGRGEEVFCSTGCNSMHHAVHPPRTT